MKFSCLFYIISSIMFSINGKQYAIPYHTPPCFSLFRSAVWVISSCISHCVNQSYIYPYLIREPQIKKKTDASNLDIQTKKRYKIKELPDCRRMLCVS